MIVHSNTAHSLCRHTPLLRSRALEQPPDHDRPVSCDVSSPRRQPPPPRSVPAPAAAVVAFRRRSLDRPASHAHTQATAQSRPPSSPAMDTATTTDSPTTGPNAPTPPSPAFLVDLALAHGGLVSAARVVSAGARRGCSAPRERLP